MYPAAVGELNTLLLLFNDLLRSDPPVRSGLPGGLIEVLLMKELECVEFSIPVCGFPVVTEELFLINEFLPTAS